MPLGNVRRVLLRSGIDEDTIGTSEAQFKGLVDDLLAASTAFVERETDRDFDLHSSETEKLDGNGTDTLRLSGRPVISVTSVSLGGDVMDTDDYRVTTSGVLEKRVNVWPKGWENVEVVYTYGYQTPPQDIVQVVEDLVIKVLRNSGPAEDLKSWSMDGYSVTLADISEVVDEQDMKTLRKHRKLGMA